MEHNYHFILYKFNSIKNPSIGRLKTPNVLDGMSSVIESKIPQPFLFLSNL